MIETDLSDDDNENTHLPSTQRTNPLHQQQEPQQWHLPQSPDQPRIGGPPPPHPDPQQQPVSPRAAAPQPHRTVLTHAPSGGGGSASGGGSGATCYSYGGGGGGSPWPPPRPLGMYPLPRERSIASHPIILSRPTTPGTSPPQQRPLPLYPLPQRPHAHGCGDVGSVQGCEENEPGTSSAPLPHPPPPQLRARRVVIPAGHAPPHHPPSGPMRLQEGPWRAFAGPRLAARPLRTLHPHPEATLYDAQPLAGELAPPHVRHHTYTPPAPLPTVPPPPPRMPPATYRALPRQHGGSGAQGHSYSAPPRSPSPWMDSRVASQCPPYGLSRLPPIRPPLPQPVPGYPRASHLLSHPPIRLRHTSIPEARKAAAAAAAAVAAAAATAAVAAATTAALPTAAAAEQSGESPSATAGVEETTGGGDGDGSMVSPHSASANVLGAAHHQIEVTVAVRSPRGSAAAAAIAGAIAGSAAAALAGDPSSTTTGNTAAAGPSPTASGGGRATSGREDPLAAAQTESRSGYIRGPVCGTFDLPRYMAGRDCIFHNGRWMSRSNFERVGGSKMAKWYRSIRVLPDLEPLGEWLERHSLQVTKGPARRSSKRVAADSGDDTMAAAAAAVASAAVLEAAEGGLEAATATIGGQDSIELNTAATTSAAVEAVETAAPPESYDAFVGRTRILVRQDGDDTTAAGAGNSGELSVGKGKRRLAISPLLQPSMRPAPPTSSLPSQFPLPRRARSGTVGGPGSGSGGGLYGIPVRRPGSTFASFEASYSPEAIADGPPRQPPPPPRPWTLHPQESTEASAAAAAAAAAAVEEDYEQEDDLVAAQWLFRRTGQIVAANKAGRQRPPPPPPPPLQQKHRAEAQQPVSPPMQMRFRWAELAAAAAPPPPVLGTSSDPELLRPRRRQRLNSPRDCSTGDMQPAGHDDIGEDPPASLQLAPTRRHVDTTAAGGGGSTSQPPPSTGPRPPELVRVGQVLSGSSGSQLRYAADCPPALEHHEEDYEAMDSEPPYPYVRQVSSLVNSPYYRPSRRVVTIAAPLPVPRGGGDGGSTAATTAAVAAAAAAAATLASRQVVFRQRQRYEEDMRRQPQPLPSQQPQRAGPLRHQQHQQHQQLRYSRQDWVIEEGDLLDQEVGEEAGQEEDVTHLYFPDEHMYERHALQQPYLPQQHRRRQQHTHTLTHIHHHHQQQQQQQQQHQQQQFHQLQLQQEIDSRQRAEMDEYALRHRAMRRRHQQQAPASEDEAYRDDDREH